MASPICQNGLHVPSNNTNNGSWTSRMKTLSGFCSHKAIREGPKLLLKIAIGFGILTALTYLWSSSRKSGFYFITGATPISRAPTSGLRMVVFGGGDVATPSDDEAAWTEVMCQKLGCATYLSFIPKTDGVGGSVMSNQLLDAAYKCVNISTAGSSEDDNTTGLDYSWVPKQYPKPTRPDLAAQINSFLATRRAHQAPAETLWVFHIGFWDIWQLAALPRQLATEVLDANIRDLFFQIERLYQAAQDRESIAFSDYYSEPQGSSSFTPSETRPRAGEQHSREPFRIFMTRVFDITLTPGFVTLRPDPPHTHLSSDQLRNAAFLARYWDAVLEMAVNDWLATPDPDEWSVVDTLDMGLVKALFDKQSVLAGMRQREEEGDGNGIGSSSQRESSGTVLPRRAVASYGLSRYLKELMIDRQLRNAGLEDSKGLGARPVEDGFLYIATPCVGTSAGDEQGPGSEGKIQLCEDPNNHLFYTEFTVGRRAIHEIGVRAARKFLDQVEVTSRWRRKTSE